MTTYNYLSRMYEGQLETIRYFPEEKNITSDFAEEVESAERYLGSEGSDKAVIFYLTIWNILTNEASVKPKQSF